MIWIALTFGLVSSLHCTLMCAPLQAVVMGQWLRNGKKANWFLYHAGRISTYGVLGLLAGLVGTALGLPYWQQEFTIVAGLLLLFGYFGLKTLRWDRKLNALITPFIMRMQGRVRNGRGKKWYFLSGSINGLLPCGMVYAALIPAAGANHPGMAGLSMIFFGLGTLPLLLSLNLAGNQLMMRFSPHFQKLIPITVALIAVVLILRGMNLDIPYLSPAMPVAEAGTAVCD